jgi:excisionase family DNA binding protein
MSIESTQVDTSDHALRGPERVTNAGGDLHELLTVDDVAALLKVGRSWVYEHTRNRGTKDGERLPHVRIGKYVRFEAKALRAYLDKKCRRT